MQVAARAVLAKNGVDAVVAHPRCCGMPKLEHGDLEAVAAAAAGGQLGAGRLASLRFVARARDLMTRERNEEALDLLERSMGLDGGSWYTWLYMAEAWRRGGDPARGRVYLEKLDGRVPDDDRLALEIELLRRQVYLPAGLTGEFSGRDG